MELSALRDLVIIIFGFLGIVATLLFVALTIVTYRKVAPILSAAKETAANVRTASSFISENVLRPIAKASGFISGLRKAIEFMIRPHRKEGEKSGEQ